MRKKILSLIVAFTFFTTGFSQLTLPAVLGFDGQEIPQGWTTNPASASFYTATSVPNPPALKMTSTGHSLIGELASTPGEMKYKVTGNPVPGNPWNGVFQVQESVDGTTYTLVNEHNGTNIVEQTYTEYTVQLDGATRFVRFLFVEKISGNIGLDDINIQAGLSNEQEMSVSVNGSGVVPQQTVYTTSDLGADMLMPFVIQNLGAVEDLVIDNIEILGTEAGDYSLSNTVTFPLTINGLDSEDIGIVFEPTAAGTRSASIKITSNDLSYPEFVFNIEGYGDNLASEPTVQATNLTFSNVKTFRIVANFTAAADADGYLILRKTGEAITEVPVDGVVYSAGDVIGDAKVVKSTTSTTFVPNDIAAATDYHFAVFAYNGVGEGVNYLTTNPLVGNQTTLTDMIPVADYANIDPEAENFVSDLHAVTTPHFQNYYGDYPLKMVENFYARDTINGKRVMTCQYTGNQYLYDFPFSFGTTGMSREHTFPNSWFPLSDNNANFYSDYHNLLLIHQDDANGIRSNYPLGIVVSDSIQVIGEAILGKDANGNWVYEPMDISKGTAARAMMYMSIRYTENGTVWSFPSPISSSISYAQDQTILKQWNTEFPPSNSEIARNDYIDSLQNNRNPFIDHPEYACYIDFMNMGHLIDGCETSSITEEMLSNAFIVYPNPAKESITIAVDGTKLNGYTITDLEGRIVKSEIVNNAIAKEVNISNLSSGLYIITAKTEYGEATKKIIVE